MTVYVDTSILAAYYCPEPLSDQAEGHLRSLRPPVISWLVDVELHSALARKVREHELERKEAQQVQSLFRTHRNQGLYHILPIGRADFVQARRWMATCKTALRTLDSLHVAVAHRHDLRVLTADRGMAQAGGTFGVDTELVRADPR